MNEGAWWAMWMVGGRSGSGGGATHRQRGDDKAADWAVLDRQELGVARSQGIRYCQVSLKGSSAGRGGVRAQCAWRAKAPRTGARMQQQVHWVAGKAGFACTRAGTEGLVCTLPHARTCRCVLRMPNLDDARPVDTYACTCAQPRTHATCLCTRVSAHACVEHGRLQHRGSHAVGRPGAPASCPRTHLD